MMDSPNTTHPRLAVTCRPARPGDTSDVLELTKNIWGGHDYVPSVWQAWLADPEGLLAVAELDGLVLGLGKLTRLSQDDWWMEGLRVHPEYWGHGIASQLHEYLLGHWLKIGQGIVRLASESAHHPVHHLCQRLGFEKIGEWAFFAAPAQYSQAAQENFNLVTPDELPGAVAWAQNSPSLQLTAGLVDLGWQWAPLREAYLVNAVSQGKAWWWRGRRGMLAIYEDTDEQDQPVPSILLLACELELIADCLRDYRSLAAALGYARAVWNAPLRQGLMPILEAAGFKRVENDTIYLYAKRHPQE